MDRGQRVGANIKHFRELAGLTKSELARRVKVSPTAVNNWEENGVIPRMEVMLDLEKALEVSWTQLRNRDADKAAMPANFDSPTSFPEVSKGESLDQLKRQIAALFDVAADKVEIVIRT